MLVPALADATCVTGDVVKTTLATGAVVIEYEAVALVSDPSEAVTV
jgi:hypothetical protein